MFGGDGNDTITDFTDEQDSIGLADGLSFSDLTIAGSSNSTQISVMNTRELLAILSGVNPIAISAVDFIAV
jgi:hypothetical protein